MAAAAIVFGAIVQLGLGLGILLSGGWALFQGHGIGLLPHGLGMALVLVCMLQFSLSLWMDLPYDKGLLRIGFWMIWYPLAFWLITFGAALVALPRVLFRREGLRARWVSPDRGVRG